MSVHWTEGEVDERSAWLHQEQSDELNQTAKLTNLLTQSAHFSLF